MLQCQIGAICAKGVGNRWITFFFIVLQHISYGRWHSVCLVSIRLCRIKLLSCQLPGRASSVDTKIQIFGGLCRIVCFGAYGGSGMLDVLRIVNGLSWIYSLSSSVLSLNGVQFCRHVLVCPYLFQLIIVIWFFNCCHYSMFLVYLAFLFLIKYLTLFIKRKGIQLAIHASQNVSLFNIISRNYIKVTSLCLPTSRRINSRS